MRERNGTCHNCAIEKEACKWCNLPDLKVVLESWHGGPEDRCAGKYLCVGLQGERKHIEQRQQCQHCKENENDIAHADTSNLYSCFFAHYPSSIFDIVATNAQL